MGLVERAARSEAEEGADEDSDPLKLRVPLKGEGSVKRKKVAGVISSDLMSRKPRFFFVISKFLELKIKV